MTEGARAGSSHEGGGWRLLAVLLLLLLLCWGLLASDRGLHDDDVTFLAGAQTRLAEAPLELLQAPRHTPTRKLPLVAFAVAAATGSPRLVLQAGLGIVWLALGLVAYLMCRELLPRRPRVAAAAAVLTISATGDFYAFSTGSLHYQLSTLACFCAVWVALRYCSQGGLQWLLATPVLISLSVWQVDAGLTTLALTPVLLWIHAGYRVTRRLLTVLAVSSLAVIPYAVAFARFMLDPTSYAAWGVQRPEGWVWFQRALDHVLYNFTPWQWFTRPQRFFGWDVDQLLPLSFVVTAGLLGGGVVLYWLRGVPRSRAAEHRAPGGSPFAVGGMALLMVVAANAMFAVAQLAEYYYRTHLVSRVWAALVMAILFELLAQRLSTSGSRGGRLVGNWLVPVATGLFVFFGVLGGLERQNFYLASWRLQQAELRSIVDVVPDLRDDAVLVLNLPSQVRGLASQDTEIARQWAVLLYGDRRVGRRVYVISQRGGGCEPDAGGLRCWHERALRPKFSQRRNASWNRWVPYERVIVLTYSASTGRFKLNRRLPQKLRVEGAHETDGYRPEELIGPGPVPKRVRSLLGGGSGLARFFG